MESIRGWVVLGAILLAGLGVGQAQDKAVFEVAVVRPSQAGGAQ